MQVKGSPKRQELMQSEEIQQDKEFLQLMLEIEEKYQHMSKHDRIRIEQWSKKLCQVTSNATWKKNRNLYTKQLLQNVLSFKLQSPFIKAPPDGPLKKFNKYEIAPVHIQQREKQWHSSKSPQSKNYYGVYNIYNVSPSTQKYPYNVQKQTYKRPYKSLEQSRVQTSNQQTNIQDQQQILQFKEQQKQLLLNLQQTQKNEIKNVKCPSFQSSPSFSNISTTDHIHSHMNKDNKSPNSQNLQYNKNKVQQQQKQQQQQQQQHLQQQKQPSPQQQQQQQCKENNSQSHQSYVNLSHLKKQHQEKNLPSFKEEYENLKIQYSELKNKMKNKEENMQLAAMKVKNLEKTEDLLLKEKTKIKNLLYDACMYLKDQLIQQESQKIRYFLQEVEHAVGIDIIKNLKPQSSKSNKENIINIETPVTNKNCQKKLHFQDTNLNLPLKSPQITKTNQIKVNDLIAMEANKQKQIQENLVKLQNSLQNQQNQDSQQLQQLQQQQIQKQQATQISTSKTPEKNLITEYNPLTQRSDITQIEIGQNNDYILKNSCQQIPFETHNYNLQQYLNNETQLQQLTDQNPAVEIEIGIQDEQNITFKQQSSDQIEEIPNQQSPPPQLIQRSGNTIEFLHYLDSFQRKTEKLQNEAQEFLQMDILATNKSMVNKNTNLKTVNNI